MLNLSGNIRELQYQTVIYMLKTACFKWKIRCLVRKIRILESDKLFLTGRKDY